MSLHYIVHTWPYLCFYPVVPVNNSVLPLVTVLCWYDHVSFNHNRMSLLKVEGLMLSRTILLINIIFTLDFLKLICHSMVCQYWWMSEINKMDLCIVYRAGTTAQRRKIWHSTVAMCIHQSWTNCQSVLQMDCTMFYLLSLVCTRLRKMD